jgi:hypothetical protein
VRTLESPDGKWTLRLETVGAPDGWHVKVSSLPIAAIFVNDELRGAAADVALGKGPATMTLKARDQELGLRIAPPP